MSYDESVNGANGEAWWWSDSDAGWTSLIPGGHLPSFDRDSCKISMQGHYHSGIYTRCAAVKEVYISPENFCKLCFSISWERTVYQLMPLIKQVWCSPAWKGNKVNLTPGLAHRDPLSIEARISIKWQRM